MTLLPLFVVITPTFSKIVVFFYDNESPAIYETYRLNLWYNSQILLNKKLALLAAKQQ